MPQDRCLAHALDAHHDNQVLGMCHKKECSLFAAKRGRAIILRPNLMALGWSACNPLKCDSGVLADKLAPF